MGYFQVRYNSRVVIYDHRAFIRLATAVVGYLFLQSKEVALDCVLTRPTCLYLKELALSPATACKALPVVNLINILRS